MRKVSFAVAVGLVLSACGGGEGNQAPNTPATPPVATTPVPTTTATAEAPKQDPKPELTLAQKTEQGTKMFMEAMNAHDAKKVAGFYAETSTMNVVGMPELKGRAAIEEHFKQLYAGFPDLKMGVSRVFQKGDVTAVEWVMTGTHTGEFMGMKATEKKIGVSGASMLWMGPDGLVTKENVYHDANTIMAQLGLSKEKARPVATLPTSFQVYTPANTPEEQKNVDAAKAWAKAFETKKEADFVAGVADNVEWDDYTQPEAMKGKDSGKKYFNGMLKAFPDAKAGQSTLFATGEFVVEEGNFEGTHKGSLFGAIPPTQKKVNMHDLTIVQFKDGKVVKGWSYGNSAEMMAQLGLLKAETKKADTKAAEPKKTPDAKPADKAADPKAAPKK